MKKITVKYFDLERFEQAWMYYKFKPLKYDGRNYTGKINPLNGNWNTYFSTMEVETEKFERFHIDGSDFIEIDSDYLFDDGGEHLYLWEELKKAEVTYAKYREISNFQKVGEWFPGVKKVIERDKTLEKILNTKL